MRPPCLFTFRRWTNKVRNSMKGAVSQIGHSAWRAVLLLASGSLAACGGSAAARQTQATVPDTTIPPVNSYAVPPHITAAYVQRVLDALDKVDGDATRLIVANRSLVPAAVYRLEAIDADAWFTEETSTWTDEITAGLKGYRTTPGNVQDTVKQVLYATPSCTWIETMSDYRAVAVRPSAPSVNYIQLVPAIPGRDTGGWNPTPWMIALEGYNSHGLVPSDPCAASS